MAEEKEKERSEIDAVATKDYGTQLQSHMPEHAVTAEHRRKIRAAARKKDPVPVTSTVKTIVGLGLLTAIGFIVCVFYFLYLNLAHDANLEKKILSGTTDESLKALKHQTIQINNMIFGFVIVVLILIILIVFGYQVFHSDVTRHKDEKTDQVLEKAEEAVDHHVDVIARLTTDRELSCAEVCRLNKEVKGLEDDIKERSKREERNEKEIKQLLQQKLEKEIKLEAAEAKLRGVKDRLKAVEESRKALKDDYEQKNRRLREDVDSGRARISRLAADLQTKESEVNSLRNRSRACESSTRNEESRSSQCVYVQMSSPAPSPSRFVSSPPTHQQEETKKKRCIIS